MWAFSNLAKFNAEMFGHFLGEKLIFLIMKQGILGFGVDKRNFENQCSNSLATYFLRAK